MFTLMTLTWMGIIAVAVVTVLAAGVWYIGKVDEMTREPGENEFNKYR